jgi:hypothetical protein
MLEESGQFSRVIVQSISLKTLPTPTPAPTPTAITPTPAPEETVVEFVILVGLAEVSNDQ